MTEMLLDGGVTITCLEEGERGGDDTTLLTVRWTHDLTSADCGEIADALLRAADMLEDKP